MHRHPARRPIRLTCLITDLNTGGVPLHLYRLASRLPADRFRVRVIALAGEGPVGELLRRAGVPVSTCDARGAGDVRALARLWERLRRDPPDLLHAYLFHANMAARVIGPLSGVPVHRILCEIQTVEIERPWHLVLDNLTCRLCRFEVGNSPSVVAHLRRRAHIPASRLRCEWGAVDVEVFDRASPLPRAALGVPEDEPLLLWTGRLDPVKGFEEMLEAFAHVCRVRPARLLLAGEGPYRQAVERLIRRLQLDDRVALLGRRDDVPALLKTADLFLFCSRTEGLPNALMEAMAAGVPVVATDVPGCRDLITSGETGLLVPSGSIESIARAVLHLLEDRRRARSLSEAARAWVSRSCDAPSWIARWVRLYESVIASR